jgi:hypothetical protein
MTALEIVLAVLRAVVSGVRDAVEARTAVAAELRAIAARVEAGELIPDAMLEQAIADAASFAGAKQRRPRASRRVH